MGFNYFTHLFEKNIRCVFILLIHSIFRGFYYKWGVEMRINNFPVGGVQKAYNQYKKEQKTEGLKEGKNDGVQLSSEGQLVSVALQALRQLPESDQEKLTQIKEAVKTGNYQISNDKVAEKIWQESILNEKI